LGTLDFDGFKRALAMCFELASKIELQELKVSVKHKLKQSRAKSDVEGAEKELLQMKQRITQIKN
jgi:hypothetical protein